MNVDGEIELLKHHIQRLGEANEEGGYTIKFGVLFRDDDCANVFEALVGTLKAAKKRKIIEFPGQMLLSPTHDDVVIKLLQC